MQLNKFDVYNDKLEYTIFFLKELTPQWTAEEIKGRYETKASACHDVASHGGEVKHYHGGEVLLRKLKRHYLTLNGH